MKSQKNIKQPLLEAASDNNSINLKITNTYELLDESLISITDETDTYWSQSKFRGKNGPYMLLSTHKKLTKLN
jgi:hypothetical protein